MENNDYNFDLDSILAEFVEEKKSENKAERRSLQPDYPQKETNKVDVAEPADDSSRNTARKSFSKEEMEQMFASAVPQRPEKKTQVKVKEPVNPDSETKASKTITKQTRNADDMPNRVRSRDIPSAEDKASYSKKPPLMNIIFAAAFGICLVWGLFNLNPYKTSSVAKPVATPIATAKVEATPEAVTSVPSAETETENTPEETVAEVQKTKYVLEEGQMAPKANPNGFGKVSVQNASEMTAVYDKARELGLLRADEQVYFDPSINFNTGSYYKDIQYYLDETILVVCWKEIEEGSTLTMCEIKIADGSQFRMEVFGDIFNENDNSYLSQMVLANNAVVAMNSDKCKARGDGVLVCNRTLYKYNENTYAGALKRYNCLDNCYVTGNGDFLFSHRLEEKTTEEMQQFIADNNIIFSISFGPLLIENGEMVYGYNPGDDGYIEYAFGETEKPYSRCGMGQIDERHYLYTSLNHSDEAQARWTMREFGQHMYDRHILKNFYALDGGQTAEIILNDPSSIPSNANDWAYNHIDFGAERLTSNCIYFASAIPNN